MVYLDAITVPTGSFFKNIAKLAIWSTIEPGIGIIAASVATLRHLFQRLFKHRKMFGARWTVTAPTTSNTIACTTTITQELSHMNSEMSRQVSNVTTLQGSAAWVGKSLIDRSMAVEMRAYGMHDFDECTTLTEHDLASCDTTYRTRSSSSTVYQEQRTNMRYERSKSQSDTGALILQSVRSSSFGNSEIRKE